MAFNSRVATVPLEVVKETPSAKTDDVTTIFVHGFQQFCHVTLSKEKELCQLSI
jgi:hypothetical protein